MKFWQSIAWVEHEQLVPLARFAEELGLDGLLNADHAIFPETVHAPYPYSADGKPPMTADSPYPDCWVSLAFMAAATTRLRFSTSIYVLPLRNPFEVAKATGTLALMSDHRFALGIGAGWMKDEFDIYGVPFAARGKRMDDMIEVLRKLWAGGMVEHHSEFHDFPPLCIEPAPRRHVPVFVGGDNPAALRRAAQLGDGWVGAGNTPENLPPILETLQRLRVEAGKQDQPFETLVGLNTTPTVDTLKRLGDKGMTTCVLPPFLYTLGKTSTLDAKKRVMEDFARQLVRPLAS